MYPNVFEELFERYLNNTLSEADELQLMKFIKEGTHDDFIKEKINMILKEKQNTEILDAEKGDHILQYILAQTPAESKVISIEGKSSSRRIFKTFIAAAAVIALFFAVRSVFFYNQNPVIATPQETETEKPNSILSYNGKQLIHLPDGSSIVLNENSSIEYDQSSFNTKTREVKLSGEAYFDIKRNEKVPFIVHTGKVSTKVLGTAFNINAFTNSDQIEVTVARGKVQVGDDEKVYGIITPNQQIKVNKETLVYEQNNVKAEEAMVWKSKYLILDNINMEQAIAMISQKYKTPIKLANQNIKNCQITASFLNDEDLDHIMKVICSVIETEYHYDEKGIIILDGKGCQ